MGAPCSHEGNLTVPGNLGRFGLFPPKGFLPAPAAGLFPTAVMVASTFLLQVNATATRLQAGWRGHVARAKRRRRSGAAARASHEVLRTYSRVTTSSGDRDVFSRRLHQSSRERRQKVCAAEVGPQLPRSTVSQWGAGTMLVRRSSSKWGRVAPTGADLRLARMKRASSSVAWRGTLLHVPYWARGNDDMFTREVLQARVRIRIHPAVEGELQRWWEMVQSGQSGQARGGNARGVGDTRGLLMQRGEYLQLSLRIYRALIPAFDEAEAIRSAGEDWLADACGRPALTREEFLNSLFELADLWTATVEPDEYVEFLRTLLDAVAAGKPNDYCWRPLTEVALVTSRTRRDDDAEGPVTAPDRHLVRLSAPTRPAAKAASAEPSLEPRPAAVMPPIASLWLSTKVPGGGEGRGAEAAASPAHHELPRLPTLRPSLPTLHSVGKIASATDPASLSPWQVRPAGLRRPLHALARLRAPCPRCVPLRSPRPPPQVRTLMRSSPTSELARRAAAHHYGAEAAAGLLPAPLSREPAHKLPRLGESQSAPDLLRRDGADRSRGGHVARGPLVATRDVPRDGLARARARRASERGDGRPQRGGGRPQRLDPAPSQAGTPAASFTSRNVSPAVLPELDLPVDNAVAHAISISPPCARAAVLPPTASTPPDASLAPSGASTCGPSPSRSVSCHEPGMSNPGRGPVSGACPTPHAAPTRPVRPMDASAVPASAVPASAVPASAVPASAGRSSARGARGWASGTRPRAGASASSPVASPEPRRCPLHVRKSEVPADSLPFNERLMFKLRQVASISQQALALAARDEWRLRGAGGSTLHA